MAATPLSSPAQSDPPAIGRGAGYHAWVDLLRERTGMQVPPERHAFLATSLAARMREIGAVDADAYLEYVRRGGECHPEWSALVDHLVVQETRFFRDRAALQCVASELLPAASKRVAAGGAIHAWSAGCATGEEAYTLAMLFDMHLATQGLPARFGVIGSDLSRGALGKARTACYSCRRLTAVPAQHRRAYCEERRDGGIRIAERIRRRVSFLRANLLELQQVRLPQMDLVYCQNVLVYFDAEQRRRIVDGLVARLRPGGLLVLSAGDLIGWQPRDAVRLGSTGTLAYRRPAYEDGRTL